MNKTLNSIFVRLDVNMQNLTHNAIAQIIVKILYSHTEPMSSSAIKTELARVNGGMHISDDEVTSILNELSLSEIKKNNGKYRLSTSKREKISKTIDASETRNERILETYFDRLNSSQDVVKEWLIDASIRFFDAYSKEWISDLMTKSAYISTKEEDIRRMIANRTRSNKKLDVDDREVLPQRFFDFINTTSTEVDEYLWEYGTAAFASKLICTMNGVDAMTLDTFRNSHCILDTNILLFIALESRFKDAFKAIEKVFADLNVKVSVLYITKNEYEGKVYHQKQHTLKNLENLGYEVTIFPNDDFTELAKRRLCRTEEDFERFFYSLQNLPQQINDKVDINLYDNSSQLVDVIEKSMANEKLQSDLNAKYHAVTNRDKRKHSLRHDVGLLEGVKWLRENPETKSEKFFILSEETSVNLFSKSSGFVQGLPLSLRVDTLINLLAVNNGGDTFNAADYIPLFANIIRLGLVPQKDTFRQSELFELSQMDTRLSSLSSETQIKIVQEMHRKLLDGEKDEVLLRDLKEMLTKGEVCVRKELESTNEELQMTRKDLNQVRREAQKRSLALEKQIKAQIEKDFYKETKRMKRTYLYRSIALSFVAFIVILVMCKCWFDSIGLSLFSSFVISIVAGFVNDHFLSRKVIKERIKNRDSIIADLVEKEVNKALQDE